MKIFKLELSVFRSKYIRTNYRVRTAAFDGKFAAWNGLYIRLPFNFIIGATWPLSKKQQAAF